MRRHARTLMLSGAILCWFTTHAAAAGSRYAPLLATTSGQDTLKDLALWEDQRVTNEGRLFAYLAEGSPLVRIRAIEVIGRLQDPADAPLLIALLKDSDGDVVREAIFALGQLGNRDAVALLVQHRASRSDPAELGLIAEALGKLGGEGAIACLSEMLRDFNAGVRGDACLALARCKDPAAANALLLAVQDPAPEVAARAIYGLEKQDALPRSCPTLVDFLEHEKPEVRAAAARTLGKLACSQAVRALVARLEDDDVRVVVNAAGALRDIKAKDALKPLALVLARHRSHHARAAAAMALEKIESKDAREALTHALLDTSAMVRIHSIRAMAVLMGAKSEMYIDQMRHDGARLVRAEAIECYGRAGITTRVKELDKIARTEKDPLMRAAAVSALGQMKDPTVGALLIPTLRDPDFTVATAAVVAVGLQKHAAADEVLIEVSEMRGEREFVDFQIEAMRVLGEMRILEADSVLWYATRHEDRRVREAAVTALGALGIAPPPIPSERELNANGFDRTRRKVLGPPLGTVNAVIKTSHGDIEVELFGDDAIQTVANFLKLAREGFYRGLTTHRVVPNFVVQGGDPRGDGAGDSGYTVPAEVSRHRYATGYLGIADAGKDTGSCQWFITLSPQPHLDGRYTIFGRVTNGMEAAWKLDQGDSFNVKVVEPAAKKR